MKKLTCISFMFAAALAQSAWADAVVEHKPLDMKYDSIATDVRPAAMAHTCALKIIPVVDERQNKDTLGVNITSPLLSGDAAAWATAGLQNLSDFGFRVTKPDAADGQAAITLTPKIIRAYTWQVGMKLFGTVVLKMDYTRPDGKVESRTYRSSGDKTNMWGADSEYVTTLNYALNNLLRKVATDLDKECGLKA
ncbi:hypothetical protein LT85_1641 [Collimonas arenae]|uniref:Lipoprotein n=1 Tax=Collimonas arenae TaxID=279058 RepID=A0A0A1FAX7_9BURK|nr:hypothetical protein [Collimonas arenae]AIY40799.1 hypothetical protein LT85_1641 [Collimonas arenae]